MTLVALILAVLASWSITQLATRDSITARLRLRLRRALRWREHHAVGTISCSCTWIQDLVDDPTSDTLDEHIRRARAANPGWAYTLVTCPWCVSLWISLAVGASAYWWGDTWPWQILAFALGARIVAGAGVIHLGPPPDDNEDVGSS